MRAIDDFIDTENELLRRRHSFLYGYLPTGKLIIDPSLRLHQTEDFDLDPITYEVIRSKLWNLNVDHGETVRRTSGSSPVVDANDFNASIATEIGEGTAFGPYMWFFAGYTDLGIKWTLEHRSTNPGIHDGDVFIHDDPWIGTNHANDTAVFSPLFWDGELFAWLYNCADQRDVGGATPGSQSPNARDVYGEGVFFPPLKLVERGYVREDILDCLTRRSRLPEITSLELKAQLSGVNFARGRLIEIVERYGPGAVKRAMNKQIEDSSRIVGERLSRLPDGIWRDECYLASGGVGDARPYKLCLAFEKRGDRLRVSNAGTDAAANVNLNHSLGAFRGSVVSSLFHTLAFDLDLCGAGLLRQLDFDIEPGRLNSATHPSACGTSVATMAVCSQTTLLAAKMVSGDDELSFHGMAPCTTHTMSTVSMWGIDQYNNAFGGYFIDTIAGGSGAFPTRDGIDHTGPAIGVCTPIPDVETVERGMPVLCLYRRELLDSGAHGRFRGGMTITSAWIGHNSSSSSAMLIGLATGVTLGRGVDGALPATAGTNWYADNSSCREWFAEGRIPATQADLRTVAPIGGKAVKEDRPFGPTSVYELIANAGAAHGDPVTRDPVAVVTDFEKGRVSEVDADRIYGVALSEGGFDEGATLHRRGELLEHRLTQSRAPRQPLDGTSVVTPEDRRVLASVIVSNSGEYLACAHCGQRLSEWSGNYRLGCCELEESLPSLSPLFDDPVQDIGEPLVLRRYLCPACGIALDGDICRPTDAPYQDLRLTTEIPSRV